MALIEMRMKVYKSKHNYMQLSTLTETQKEKYLKEREQEEYERDNEFETWLSDHYTQLEIFNMDELKKKAVDEEWRKSCKEYVEELFKDDYEEEEITLKVEEEELNTHESFRLIGI